MKEKINETDLLSFIGKKWTIPILFAITHVPKTYSEIYCELNSSINHTLFSKRLKSLSKMDLIKKIRLDKGNYFYQITPKGQILKKKIRELLFFDIE